MFRDKRWQGRRVGDGSCLYFPRKVVHAVMNPQVYRGLHADDAGDNAAYPSSMSLQKSQSRKASGKKGPCMCGACGELGHRSVCALWWGRVEPNQTLCRQASFAASNLVGANIEEVNV